MNKAAENANGYTWMANTFQKVDGSVTKLSDFSLSESQAPTAVKLYLLNAAGATLKDKDGKEQSFVFVHPARCTAANGWVTGWYHLTLNGTNIKAAEFKLGSTSAYWANDKEIPYGQGFGINRGSADTTIVFSGAVANEDKPVAAVNANGYSWMGNVMPVDYKLKDLSLVESQAPTAVKLYKLNAAGATLKDESGREQAFVFVHPVRCTEANGWVTGWYYLTLNGVNIKAAEFKLGSTSTYWANDIEIKAGEGFGINRGSAATTLYIPSPLVDHTTAE